MGLKAMVCFTGDMDLGFGQDMGLGFVFCWRLIIGKNTREEHNQHEHVLLKKIMKRKKRRRKKTRKTFN